MLTLAPLELAYKTILDTFYMQVGNTATTRTRNNVTLPTPHSLLFCTFFWLQQQRAVRFKCSIKSKFIIHSVKPNSKSPHLTLAPNSKACDS